MNLAEAEAFLSKRVTAKQQASIASESARGDSVRAYLFDKQLALADDEHRFITACCGRRGGKTVTVAAMMLRAAKRHPRRIVLYLHLTRGQAKLTIWPTLKQLNEEFGLGGESNESDLTITMPNGAIIALAGVDKRKEIEKRRGLGFSLVVIDECQSIPEYVKSLVDEVIAPALADVPGRLVMIGTPSLLESGYWFQCHHNPNAVWGHYSWTMWDNPHMPDPDTTLAAELARRGVTIDDASIQREWFAKWIRDASSAVFAFDPARNTYSTLPAHLKASLWAYVISVDIGGGVNRDNDAISVLAFHPHARATWLVEEHIDARQDVTALSLKVVSIRDRLGADRVLAIVADTGGLGAKVAEEMSRRHGLGVKAAKKADKWTNIEILNAACRHGEFFAPADSAFATESVKVEKDWDKSTPDRIVIKGHMPDACDAALYGYVESLAWISEEPKPKPVPGSVEWAAAQEDEMEAREEERIAAQLREERGETEGVGNSSDWETGW